MAYLNMMVLRGAAPRRGAKKHAAPWHRHLVDDPPSAWLSDLADSLFRVGSILRRAYGTFQTHGNPGHYSDNSWQDWFGIVAVLTAEKSSSDCHDSYQTAL